MRLRALVLAQDERAVLKGLGQLGAVHLTHTHPGPDTAPLPPIDNTAELIRYDRIRSRIKEFRQSLEILPLTTELRLKEEFTTNQADEILQSLEQKSEELLAHRQHIVQRQKELANLCERVSNFRGFDIPLDECQFSFLRFVTGSLPAQNFDRLQKEVGDNVVLLHSTRQKGQQSLLV